MHRNHLQKYFGSHGRRPIAKARPNQITICHYMRSDVGAGKVEHKVITFGGPPCREIDPATIADEIAESEARYRRNRIARGEMRA